MSELRLGDGRLAALDGLRGVAAFAVVVLHGAKIFQLGWAPHHAYLAVDFFFLLSGYVIARAFDRRLTAGWAWPFIKRRLIRLYPLIVVGCVLGFAVLAARAALAGDFDLRPPLVDLASSLLLSPAPPIFASKWHYYKPDPVLWSLFFEVAVNIVYALAAPWLRGARFWGLVLLSGAGLAVSAVLIGNADFGLVHFPLATFRVLFSFFVGVAMARAFVPEKMGGRLSTRTHVYIFAILSVILLSPLEMGPAYDLFAILVVFPVLLLLTLMSEPPGRWANGCLIAGTLSYPVYMIHHPIFRAEANLLTMLDVGVAGRTVGFAVGVLVVGAASWALAKAFDEPVRKWLTARLPDGGRKTFTLEAGSPRRL